MMTQVFKKWEDVSLPSILVMCFVEFTLAVVLGWPLTHMAIINGTCRIGIYI